MSRAFTKEPDGSEKPEDLPERVISPHRNFVTASGMKFINDEIARLTAAETTPQNSRDLNYWLARRINAELIPPPENHDEVRFGHKVTIQYENGTSKTYQITGQDEADPAKGQISYVSPLARDLLGKTLGDTIETGSGEAEITAIKV